MATPFDVKLAELPAAERAEITELLAQRPAERWSSDEGDGLAWHLLLAVAAIAGVVAVSLEFSLAQIAEFWVELPVTLPRSLASPIVGGALALLLLPLLLWRFRVLHGRHGWLVASFGLVRVRGPRLRVARWQDVVRVTRRRVGTTRGFVMVELTTQQGVLACDTGALLGEIVRRVPASAAAPG